MSSTATRLRAERARRARSARAREKERRRLAACRKRARKRGIPLSTCAPTSKKAPKVPKAPAAPAKPSITVPPAPTSAPVLRPQDPVPGPAAPSPAQPTPAPATPVGPAVPDIATPPVSQAPTSPPWAAVRFGRAEATRLLWRAGFGPRPGDVDRLLDLGLEGAIEELVAPPAAKLIGAEPHDQEGRPLDPVSTWGHDQLWWLDRMVRSNQPLVERMTLVWHDWFATSLVKVGDPRMMLQQNRTMRDAALGSFPDLLQRITKDPAMLLYLDGMENSRGHVNENYGREVMELFTLGAGRGAYTEQDVREISRAFTGLTLTKWDTDGSASAFQTDRWDAGSKTVFGRTGAFDWQDACDLLVDHPMHASFFVSKLWSNFVPTPPDAATQAELQRIYVAGGHQVTPVLRAILSHPDLHHGAAMVKPPAVFVAGLLRALGRTIDVDHWAWILYMCGQILFGPPNVAGWDDSRWMNSATWRGRYTAVACAVQPQTLIPWSDVQSVTESPEAAVDRAIAFWGNPPVSADNRDALILHARAAAKTPTALLHTAASLTVRQNGLRLLVGSSSDLQVS